MEAVWNALLEMEPQLAQMEEPDVPKLTAKFLDELRLRGFVIVALAISKPPATQSLDIWQSQN